MNQNRIINTTHKCFVATTKGVDSALRTTFRTMWAQNAHKKARKKNAPCKGRERYLVCTLQKKSFAQGG